MSSDLYVVVVVSIVDYDNNKRRKKDDEQESKLANHGHDLAINNNIINNAADDNIQNNNNNYSDNADDCSHQNNNITINNNINDDTTTDDYDSDDSDDSDDDIMDNMTQVVVNNSIYHYNKLKLIIGTILPTLLNPDERNNFYHTRIDWDNYMNEYNDDDEFDKTYRMNKEMFSNLVKMLTPYVDYNPKYAKRANGLGDYTVEIIIHCTIRWLAGGSYLDIKLITGISIPGFYHIIHKGMDAILLCKELDSIKFPSNNEEIETMAENFAGLSSHNLFTGCVGAIDGYLCLIKRPSHKKVDHVLSFFSGHYQCYGVNIQACCDHLCRFTYVAIAGPGGMNDIKAYDLLSIKKTVANLPNGYYLIGDNAYIPSEHFLTPFKGKQRENPACDAYNYYLSQLRIRIEMSFGIMTNKWRILKKPLEVDIKNVRRVVMSICRLHNYVISSQPSIVEEKLKKKKSPGTSNTNVGDSGLGYLPSDNTMQLIPGVSAIRDNLVKAINNLCLTRPAQNIQRNNDRYQQE